MLRANQRYILHYDFAMVPTPSDAPALPLGDFIKPLIKRCKDGDAVQTIDDEKRIIRLVDAKLISTQNKTKALALLLTLGDKEKADPGFTNVKSGKVRIPEKDDDEVNGLSVHVVISTEPVEDGSHLYKMVCEDVTGFGRTLIQRFIRHEFAIISNELGFTFDRPGSSGLKTRPLVELVGHVSDTLKESLRSGRLVNVELIDYVEESLGFDEGDKYIKRARRDLSFSIAKSLPKGNNLSFIQKCQVWANKNGYEKMRVRWTTPHASKSQTAQLDVAKTDASEALFVKSIEVSLDTPLPDICAEFSSELLDKIKDMVE